MKEHAKENQKAIEEQNKENIRRLGRMLADEIPREIWAFAHSERSILEEENKWARYFINVIFEGRLIPDELEIALDAAYKYTFPEPYDC